MHNIDALTGNHSNEEQNHINMECLFDLQHSKVIVRFFLHTDQIIINQLIDCIIIASNKLRKRFKESYNDIFRLNMYVMRFQILNWILMCAVIAHHNIGLNVTFRENATYNITVEESINKNEGAIDLTCNQNNWLNLIFCPLCVQRFAHFFQVETSLDL